MANYSVWRTNFRRRSLSGLLQAEGLNPRRYFQSAWPAIQILFVSRLSIGALPFTEPVPEMPREYAAFAVPLGATTTMDGCAAIYPPFL